MTKMLIGTNETNEFDIKSMFGVIHANLQLKFFLKKFIRKTHIHYNYYFELKMIVERIFP